MKDLVSIFTLTLNRYELSEKVLSVNLANSLDYPNREWLVCDNGSTDSRILSFVYGQKFIPVSYVRANSKNEGVGRAFNQLFLRSKGEYLCFMGSDLLLPPKWLSLMVSFINQIPNPGMIGVSWGHGGLPALSTQFGITAHWLTPKLNRIFGIWIMKREVVEKVGLFPERYDVYGLEDSSLNERVNRAGFNSCYISDKILFSPHLGVGIEDSGEYRKMKDESMGRNAGYFAEDVARWDAGESAIEKLPEERQNM